MVPKNATSRGPLGGRSASAMNSVRASTGWWSTGGSALYGPKLRRQLSLGIELRLYCLRQVLACGVTAPEPGPRTVLTGV